MQDQGAIAMLTNETTEEQQRIQKSARITFSCNDEPPTIYLDGVKRRIADGKKVNLEKVKERVQKLFVENIKVTHA